MMAAQPNAVKCKLSQGGFSDEIVFEIELAGKGVYAGGCSRAYCFSVGGAPLGAKQLTGDSVPGKVAAHFLRDEGGGHCRIQVPDGEVLIVKEDQLATVKEASPHVPSRP